MDTLFCSKECRLAKKEVQGHGWSLHECMVSHDLLYKTEGKECPYAKKTIEEINNMNFKW